MEEREEEVDAPPFAPHPHPSLHLIPNARITTYNVNSFSSYGTDAKSKARRDNISTNCRALKQISDIVCFQETHLRANDRFAASSIFKGWTLLYNNADGRQGTLMAISPVISNNYSIQIIDLGDVPKGRLQAVRFTPKNVNSALLPFQLFNVYFPTGGTRLSARRVTCFDALNAIPPCRHTFMVGDFNFIENLDDSINSELYTLSNTAKDSWQRLLGTHSLTEVQQPLKTFFRSFKEPGRATTATRIDRVYTSHSDSDQTVFTPVCYIPHLQHTSFSYNAWKLKLNSKASYKATSDHFPVTLKFCSTAPSKKRDFNIPKWVGDSQDFVKHFNDNWNPRRLYDDSFQAELAFKKQVSASARKILKTTKTTAKDDISNITRAISLFRSVTQEGASAAQEALVEGDLELRKCHSALIAEGYDAFYNLLTLHIHSLLSGCLPKPKVAEEGKIPTKPSRVTNIIQDVKLELPSTRERLVHIHEEGKEPETCPKAMAKIVKSFWGAKVWAKRSNTPTLRRIERYLSNYHKLIPDDLIPQLPALYHFFAAIEESGDSSAGRDGIPFSIYRALKKVAAPLLMEIFISLANGARPPNGFNHGRLYLIPKDTSYKVDRLRPITVNNSSNRIITTVMVTLITPAMQALLDTSQKGFIPGRRGTDHVVNLNKVFYESIRDRENMFVLFLDTEKAFDSIDHAFIGAVMNKVGLPRWCINFVMSLFDNALVFPVLSERTSTSIRIQRGVKQGCPLSPIIFALVYDVLLVYLTDAGILLIFAFADDLAVASSDRANIQRAMEIIDVFTIFSGLGLNSNKTVIIKTHPFTIDDAVFFQNSPWEDVKLLLSHVYLGVLFGRNVTPTEIFAEAHQKFDKRLTLYRTTIQRRSIDHRIIIVNVFLTSIFSYLTQFFIVPYKEVVKKVRNSIRKAVISFNGGAMGYVHLITPTKCMGFKQPLRDLWAAGIAALASHVDLMSFNGMQHPPLIPNKPYLNSARGWDSMIIGDHRDAAALDLLHLPHARNFDGSVLVNYIGNSKSRNIYHDAVSEEYKPDILHLTAPTSLPSKLHSRWGLGGIQYAIALRANASGIGGWMPAHYRSNHIKLIFNALATDTKKERRGGSGPADRRADGFPCYLCGGSTDSSFHIFTECEVTRQAKHIFLHTIDCSYEQPQSTPDAVYTLGAWQIDQHPDKLMNAIIVFNHAVWDYRTMFFKALLEPPSNHEGATRLSAYATTLWDGSAPTKLRSGPLRRLHGFIPPVPPRQPQRAQGPPDPDPPD